MPVSYVEYLLCEGGLQHHATAFAGVGEERFRSLLMQVAPWPVRLAALPRRAGLPRPGRSAHVTALARGPDRRRARAGVRRVRGDRHAGQAEAVPRHKEGQQLRPGRQPAAQVAAARRGAAGRVRQQPGGAAARPGPGRRRGAAGPGGRQHRLLPGARPSAILHCTFRGVHARSPPALVCARGSLRSSVHGCGGI